MIRIMWPTVADNITYPRFDVQLRCIVASSWKIRPYELEHAFVLCTLWSEFNALTNAGYTPTLLRSYQRVTQPQ